MINYKIQGLSMSTANAAADVETEASGPVNTWMVDRLRVGKPSRYVTNHLGQLSLPSLQSIVKSSTSLCGWGYAILSATTQRIFTFH